MQTQLFIDGRFVPAAFRRNARHPESARQREIAQVSMAGREDVDRAVQAAKKAFPKWSRMRRAIADVCC